MDRHDPDATMIPLPATPGTEVHGLVLSGSRAVVLCGDAILTGTLTDHDSWQVLCEGGVDVALAGDLVFTARGEFVVAVEERTGRQVARLGPAQPFVHGFGVSPDGRHVAIGEYEAVSVWDVERRRRVARWKAHRRIVQHLTFGADGRTLATGSFEDFARWSWRAPLHRARRATARAGGGSVMALTADGRLVACLGRGAVGVWSPRMRLEQELAGPDFYARWVALAPDERRVAGRSPDGQIGIWTLPDGELVATHIASYRSYPVAFSPDGALLVTGDDAALLVWGEGVPEPGPERFVPRHERRLDGEAPPSALEWDALTVEAVEAAAREAPLFRHLRAPTPYDAGVERLGDWDDWHGPESDVSEAYLRLLGELGNPVERAARGLHRPEIERDAWALNEVVRDRAAEALPEPPDQDPWHSPTAAATEVAWIADLIRSHAAFGWPVPDDLRALWGWYEAGHWPCGLRGGRLRVL